MHITGQIERFSNIVKVKKLWNKNDSEYLRKTGKCCLDVRIELNKEIWWENSNLVKWHYQARDTSRQPNKDPVKFGVVEKARKCLQIDFSVGHGAIPIIIWWNKLYIMTRVDKSLRKFIFLTRNWNYTELVWVSR